MFSVIWKGYASKHVSSLRRGTCRHCSLWGYLAGKDKKRKKYSSLWRIKRGILTQLHSLSLTALIAGTQTPPSRDLAYRPVAGTLRRKFSRAHIAVQCGWSTQFDQHYVTVLRAGVVVRMAEELGRHDVLLSPVRLPDVVLSKPDLYIWPTWGGKNQSLSLFCTYASARASPGGEICMKSQIWIWKSKNHLDLDLSFVGSSFFYECSILKSNHCFDITATILWSFLIIMFTQRKQAEMGLCTSNILVGT